MIQAIFVVAIFWGWPRVGTLMAAAFSGILRPGEFLTATRKALLFPEDSLSPHQSWILWRHERPKSRRSAARYQPSRIDDAGVIALLRVLYKHEPDDSPLWDGTPYSFRRRVQAISAFFGLKDLKISGARGGGATELYELSEDAWLTLRRGRWAAFATMNIYLQETAAAQVLRKEAPEQQHRIESLVAACPFF